MRPILLILAAAALGFSQTPQVNPFPKPLVPASSSGAIGGGTCTVASGSGTIAINTASCQGTLTGASPYSTFVLSSQTGNITYTFTSAAQPWVSIQTTENATGGYTIAYPMAVASGINTNTTASISNFISFSWNGTASTTLISGNNSGVSYLGQIADPTCPSSLSGITFAWASTSTGFTKYCNAATGVVSQVQIQDGTATGANQTSGKCNSGYAQIGLANDSNPDCAAASGGSGNVYLCNGSNSATAATCPGVPSGATTYTGMTGYFVAGATSTGSPLTLNINSLGNKNVYLGGTATSSTNNVISGQMYPFYYDGTQIQLINSVTGSTYLSQISGGVQDSGNLTVQGTTSLGSGSPTPPSGGTGAAMAFGEGTAPSSNCVVSAVDCLYADSTAHRLKVSFNNAAATQLVQSGADINTSDQVTNLSNVSNVSLATAGIANSAVTLAKLANQAQDTVLMNEGASGPPTAVVMPACTTGADLYNTSTHTWSCVATPGPAITYTTTQAIAATTAISGVTQNHIRVFPVYFPSNVSIQSLYYNLSTADNTANVYDFGLYQCTNAGGGYNSGGSGSLIAHTGAAAGTVLAATAALRSAAVSGAPVSGTPGWYLFAMGSTASSPAAVLSGDSSSTRYNLPFAGSTGSGSLAATLTGGNLDATVTCPTVSWQLTSQIAAGIQY